MLDRPESWRLLQKCNKRLAGLRIVDLMGDADRAGRFTLEVGPLYADFSRHRLDAEALSLLLDQARTAGLEKALTDLESGAIVNPTEQRGAGHPRLRHGELETTLAAFERILAPLESGQWTGATGQPIDTLVNIGIGGSDLGPRLVVDALGRQRQGAIEVHFLANIDGESFETIAASVDPARTAFCVTSKSFGTEETRVNALSAREWLRQRLGSEDVGSHFLAVSSNPRRAAELGVAAERILPMKDDVGGRFSLWSTVGLPIAAALGRETFAELCHGAAKMDRHFFGTELDRNLPVILALLAVWYRNIQGCASYAVVPYDRRLRHLPAFLQQLDMESCGKRVDRDGRRLDHASGAVCWGGEGTKGQHAFFQWLHQSTDFVPLEFIAARRPDHERTEHHRRLLANLVGQATALMQGRDLAATREALTRAGHAPERVDELAPHCEFPGDRPSTVLLLERLDPAALGALLALYEHRTYVQGWLWGVNPFDQWGVELGKERASRFEPALAGGEVPAETDPVTRTLIDRLVRD